MKQTRLLRLFVVGLWLIFGLGCSSEQADRQAGVEPERIEQATTNTTTTPPASPCEELVRPVSATASSIEHAGKPASNAIDGDLGTRWSSQFNDPQWLKIDMGNVEPISRVVLHWEAAASAKYEIQLSDTGNDGTWTTLYSTTSGNGGVDDLAGLSGSGRYLRIYSTARTTQYGVSLWEVKIYRNKCLCDPPQLIAQSATASSIESSSFPASKAIEGRLDTRWSSQFRDPQWLAIDLGQVQAITRVTLHWENAAAKKYELQVSNTGVAGSWTTIYVDNNGNGGVDDITGLSASGRHLRMYSTARTTQYGVSLWEVKIYGAPPNTNDNNPCTADRCDPRRGIVHEPVAAGTSCADANACNGAEICNGAGACTPATPLVCNDGNVCNGSESCNPSTGCIPGTPLVVPDDHNPCTTDGCDPVLGVRHTPVAAGTACGDNDTCNGDELCDTQGTCQPGQAPPLDDGNPCTADQCDPIQGVQHPPAPNGTPCNDGNACTSDSCEDGACRGGPIFCPQIALPCHLGPLCDPNVGPCVYAPVPDGTLCGDSNTCNGVETCSSGQCQSTSPPVVDDGNPCTADFCDPILGVVHTPVAAGTLCADTNQCDGPEVCDGAGNCRAPTPGSGDEAGGTLGRTPWQMHQGEDLVAFGFTSPRYGDDSEYAFATIPDASDAGWTDAPNGDTIGYGIYSTLCGRMGCRTGAQFTYFQTFVSVPANVTVSTFTIAFSGMDDGVRTTIYNSAYPTGIVVPGSYVYLGGSGTANLGSLVRSGEVNRVVVTHTDDCCSGSNLNYALVELNGNAVENVPTWLDDNNPCTLDTCTAALGIAHIPLPAGTSCADGDLCNGSEVCDADGECMPGQSLAIDDDNSCTLDECLPGEGVVHTPTPQGTSCDDGDVCNGDETCDGTGFCVAGVPPDVDDSNICTADSCDPILGVVHQPTLEGSECASGDVCAGLPAQVCRSGACVQDAVVVPYAAEGYLYRVYPYGSAPADYWSSDFDDAGFSVGAAPFASGGGCPIQALRKTTWPLGTEIIVRRHLQLALGTRNLRVRVAIDNDIEIYLNGHNITGGLQTHEGCADSNQFEFTIPDDILVEGENLLAMRGRDRGAEAALDIKLSGVIVGGVPVPPVLDDDNPCTIDACEPTTGPTHSPVAEGTSCSDGDLCNGQEVCSSGECGALVCEGNEFTASAQVPGCSFRDPSCGNQVCPITTTIVGVPASDSGNGTLVVSATGDVDGNAPDERIVVFAEGTQIGVLEGENTTFSVSTATLSQVVSDGIVEFTFVAGAGTASICDIDVQISYECTSGPPNLDDGNPCTVDSCDPVAGVRHDPVPAGEEPGSIEICEADTFPGDALGAHWDQNFVGTAPEHSVQNDALVITNAALSPFNTANYPKHPGDSWVHDINVDFGNQMGWPLPIGEADFNLSFEYDWETTAPQMMQAGIALTNPAGQMQVRAGMWDGRDNPADPLSLGYPFAQVRSPSDNWKLPAHFWYDLGPSGTETRATRSGHYRITRENGAVTIYHNDVSILEAEATGEISHVSIFAVKARTMSVTYDFGTFRLRNLSVCWGDTSQSCSDDNVCNGVEACDGLGNCAAGPEPEFDDGNPCTSDVCDPVGGPTHAPAADGTSCSDGNECTGVETCIAGVCISDSNAIPCGCSPGGCDVDIEAVSIDSSTTSFEDGPPTVAGTAAVTVHNASAQELQTAFDVSVFQDLDFDGVFTRGTDAVLGSVTVAGLSADEHRSVDVPVAGAVSFPGAPLSAFVDSLYAIGETDEANNYACDCVGCEFVPEIGEFNPHLEWQWTSSATNPGSVQVMMAPIVIGLTDDNGDGRVDNRDVPDVVFQTFDANRHVPGGEQYMMNGTLRAISGDDGQEIFSATNYEVSGGVNIAGGDIDSDGLPEVITMEEYADTPNPPGLARLIALDHTGALKWRSAFVSGSWTVSSITLADLEGDGQPEVLLGNAVFRGDGTTKWIDASGGSAGHAIVADLDLDGIQEVIVGTRVYDAQGQVLWNGPSGAWGFSSVGQFDSDPEAEIVVVASGYLSMYEHTGALIWGPLDIPPGGTFRDHGGPPTIADVDNDGLSEIGVAGGRAYSVFESNGSLKWSRPTTDQSSNITGSSVFDFDGDGSVEVVYGDETHLRIYRGNDGFVLWQTPSPSGTLLELPVIADVDGDGNAEIVKASNNYTRAGSTGIQVFGDLNDTWVATRKIWNQHSYHITNINDDGTIPQHEVPSWLAHNTYRLNAQPAALSPHAAPDLISSYIRIQNVGGELQVTVRVGNAGAVEVGSGVKIAFYGNDPVTGGSPVRVVETTQNLPSGGYEDVQVVIDSSEVTRLFVVADDDAFGVGSVNECREDNNTVAEPNQVPIVHAGPDGQTSISEALALAGVATDDGLPSGILATTWSLVSGPGDAIFDDETALTTSVTFTEPGSYVLRLEASDGDLSASDEVMVEVIQPAACIPAPPGMIAWWPGDGNAEDIVGNHDGVIEGDVTFPPAEGKVGPAFNLDGATGSLVRASAVGLPTGAQPRTVEFWTKLRSDEINFALGFGYGAEVSGQGFYVFPKHISNGGNLSFSAHGGAFDLFTATNLRDQGWHHVATTYDGAVVTMYADGAPIASRSLLLNTGTSGGACIGGRCSLDNLHGFLDGHVDEVTVYGRSLTHQEIQAIYAAGNAGKCKPPVADRCFEGFDQDTAGWTVETEDGSFLGWSDDGGNPDGFLLYTDIGPTNAFARAPAKFLGDWSAAQGHTLSFDHRVVDVGECGNINQFLNIRLAGPGGRARWVSPTPADSLNWTAISARLDEADWVVEQGTFTSLLSNVTEMLLHIEVVGQTCDGPRPELDGIDNVVLEGVGCNLENQPPVANAGPDRVELINTPILISGIVSDDGLPSPAALSSLWSQVSGPGAITFGDATSPDTTVSSSIAGGHVLELTADDTEFVDSDEMLLCLSPPNQRVSDDFEDGTIGLRRWFTSCCTGSIIGEQNGLFFTGQGTAPSGVSDHKFFAVPGTFSPLGEGVAARARIRFNGDQQMFGFGVEALSQGGGPGTNIIYMYTGQRPTDAPNAVFLSVQHVDTTGTWQQPYLVQVPMTWYEFHEVEVQWRATSATFLIDGVVVGQSPVPVGCNQEVTIGNGRLQLMETDWVEVYPIGGPNNHPPLVNVGPDRTITLPASAPLHAIVTDDGLLGPAQVSWTKISGPGLVTFSPPNTPLSSASFSAPGQYVLRASAFDGELSARDELTVIVSPGPPQNQPPVVSAGPDQSIQLPVNTVQLLGSRNDDGLPSGILTSQWTQVGGSPVGVVIQTPTAPTTFVTFTLPGTYAFRLTANDGVLSAFDEVTVVVTGQPVNQPPVVDAGPDLVAESGEPILIIGDYTDDGLPVGGPVTVAWGVFPGAPGVPFAVDLEQLILDVIFYEPGTYELALIVNDGEYDAYDTVVVEVTPPTNDAPLVSAGADQEVTLPTSALLQGSAVDDGLPTGSVLSVQWEQVGGPLPATIAVPTALLTAVSFPTAGTYTFELTVSDGEFSATDQVLVVVNPAPPNQAPTVELGPDVEIQLPSNTLILGSIITHDGLPQGVPLSFLWQQTSGPAVALIATPNAAATTVTFPAPGRYSFSLTVSDSEFTVVDTVGVMVWDQPNTGEPTVELLSPEDDAVLTGATQVIGTVNDDNLHSWALEYRPVDGDNWVELASGEDEVTASELAVLDTTLMLNGQYELRLSALDLSLQQVSVTQTLTIEGQQKVGNFSVSFKDLSLPLAGIPVEVIRTYDSRDKEVGDFGFGWTLDINSVKVQKNRLISQAWETEVIFGAGPFGIGDAYCINPGKRRYVTITFADGKVFRFEAKVDAPGSGWDERPECQLGSDFETAKVEFKALPGTNAMLSRKGTDSDSTNDNDVVVDAFWPGEATLFSAEDSSSLFDPDKFVVTLHDGRQLDVAQASGLEMVTDTNGNWIKVQPDGIEHSAGQTIEFVRDGQGRITSIQGPGTHTLDYAYDAQGDLETFSNASDEETQYAYDGNHYLLGIIDARGIQPIENEYDPSGRLLSHTDALGHVIEYTHNLIAKTEQVCDRLGNCTTHEYDDRGNVLSTTDALGNVTTYSYDDRDNKLTECNALGHCSTFTYDLADNKKTDTDPLGHVTTYSYDDRGNVLTVMDPLGRVTINAYDVSGNGNLIKTTDAAGNITQYSYNVQGLQTSMTDAMGNITEYEYDANGNLTLETDALGTETEYTYDALGNRLTQSTTRTTPLGVETLLTSFEYDATGRLVKTTHPDLSTSETEYDAVGQQLATIDALGRETTRTYDDLGRLTRTTFPDTTYEESSYDAEGRRLTSRARDGKVTSFQYDQLGRLLRTIHPDGSFTKTDYDAAGRTTATYDELGKPTQFGYDSAGRRISVTDPLNKVTTFAYDDVGNQISVSDALGHTTTTQYDQLNRAIRTTYADGMFELTGYDPLGRRISKTDQAGVSTQFQYDALGRLVAVVDAMGGVTEYEYDERGNQTAQIDAEGRTTSFTYDSMGRRTSRVLPLGDVETFDYDLAGNLLEKVDFSGALTSYEYDANNRLIRKAYPDASDVEFSYTAAGQRASAIDVNGGVTQYDYDIRNRLTLMNYPDGSLLSYAYDARGARTSMTAEVAGSILTTSNGYDDRGALTSVLNPIGGTTTLSYDAAGNRKLMTQPNGVVTTYDYDAVNRLVFLESAYGSSFIQRYNYTLGPTGIRTAISELGNVTRSYDYDDLYRLTEESFDAPGTSNDYTKNFEYDDVGNRTLQQTLGEADINYAYDDRDRLLSEGGNTYAWDDNGNLHSKVGDATYHWDFEDRLVGIDFADGSSVEHVYDVDGVRVQTVTTPAGGGTPETKNYLVDTSGALSHVVAETNGSGALTAYYVRAGDQLLAVIRGTDARYYHAEGIGSIRALTDNNGVVTDSYSYTAFGEGLDWSGGDPQPYRFAGEEWEPLLGVSHLRARTYSARLGRMLSQDPLESSRERPSDTCLYAYAQNSPLSRRDPTGQFTLTESALTSAILGLVIPVFATTRAGAVTPNELITLDIDSTHFAGNSVPIMPHIGQANALYSKAGIRFRLGKTRTVGLTESKTILGDNLAVDRVPDLDTMTPDRTEEVTMTSSRNRGRINLFYVKDLLVGGNSSDSLGFGFYDSGVVMVLNLSASEPKTVAHELGHILFYQKAHVRDPGNLMYRYYREHPGTELGRLQIRRMRERASQIATPGFRFAEH